MWAREYQLRAWEGRPAIACRRDSDKRKTFPETVDLGHDRFGAGLYLTVEMIFIFFFFDICSG